MRITTVITIDNIQYRNLEEQVKKNMDDIQYILEEEGVLNEFGIKIVGQITSSSELPDPDTYQGEYGDAYAVGTDAPYTIYIYTRANGTHPNDYWFNIGQFPQPSTIPGPTGPQGPKGDPGTRGSTWTNGTSNPTSTSGYIANDKYLNTSDGTVFNFNGTSWQEVGSIRGPQGIQGQQGNVGPQGPQGIQGPIGPQGPAGPAFVIAGTVANEGQLPAPSTLADNIAYLVGNDTSGYDLYVQLQDSQTWQNVGKVEGVQGPTGPQGPQGPTGPMPQLASERGNSDSIAISQKGIENIFYGSQVTLGSGATATGYGSTALGSGATASGYHATAIGVRTTATSDAAIAIGDLATANNNYTIAIGYGATASGLNSTAIGVGAKATSDHTIVLGDSKITSLRCQVQTISALSDSRVKEDVSLANTAQCLEDVNRLPVSRYKYKDFTGTHLDVHRTGFMADDVEKVFPKSVHIADETFPVLDENGDPVYEQEVDENGNPAMKEKTFVMEDVKSIAMEMAIPTLWGAVQELTKRVESLEAQ